MNTIAGYRISRAYKKLTVWEFLKDSRQLFATECITPFPSVPRKERYEMMRKELKKRWGIKMPDYKPTKRELKEI